MTSDDHQPAVVRFCEDARAFCEFVQSADALPDRPFETLQRLLSRLAASATELPYDWPDDDQQFQDAEVRVEEYAPVYRRMSELVGPACIELHGRKGQSEEVRELALMVWDDLGDLYHDLLDGLKAYELGTDQARAEAAFRWRWGFENHWGEHLFRALLVIHQIRASLFKD
jgi:hypothetical protein